MSLCAGVFFCASPAHGDEFPSTLKIENRQLKLNGEALCEWGFFKFDLYRIALWLENTCSDSEEILQRDEARCLELRFVRSLDEGDMQKAYRESFRVNATPLEKKQFSREIQKFIDGVKAAPKRSSMRIESLPGLGITIIQGESNTLIESNKGFQDLVFRMYLGEKPPTKDVRKGLLGQHLPKVLPAE
ncbi:chalcone isomerase family protein [Planctomycetota bacterium]|nr:chalcone isomerase family protein [Planctomycetota bacterium]